MSQATGTEILNELVHQLGFDDILDEALATTDVTTVMLPYASALFSRRVPKWSRPLVRRWLEPGAGVTEVEAAGGVEGVFAGADG